MGDVSEIPAVLIEDRQRGVERDMLTMKEVWAAVAITAAMSSIITYAVVDSAHKEGRISRVEFYMDMYQNHLIMDEQEWRRTYQWVNVPNEFYKKDLNISEAIKTYENWKPASAFLLQTVIDDVCNP